MKALFATLPIMAGVYYFAGGANDYSREVDRTPSQVAAALADLDITEQPGSPGTDARRAGGVMPIISHKRTADGVTWTVMSGNQVATTMTATLTPIDDGKRTKVTASVQRGDAPDDRVSPAFRSTGLTMGLFSMALEDELNDLTRPMRGSYQACQQLMNRFEASNMASADLQTQSGLSDSMGDVAKIAVKLQAYEAESRRLGCESYRGEEPDSDPMEHERSASHREVRYGDPNYAESGGGWGAQ